MSQVLEDFPFLDSHILDLSGSATEGFFINWDNAVSSSVTTESAGIGQSIPWADVREVRPKEKKDKELEHRRRSALRSVLPFSVAVLVAAPAAQSYDSWIRAALSSPSVYSVEYRELLRADYGQLQPGFLISGTLQLLSTIDAKLFPGIAAEICNAERLLRLEANWDDSGAKPILTPTLLRSSRFLIEQARHAYRTLGVVIPSPIISAVGDGSIDLHWKGPDFELLVNVPEKSDEYLSFYGDDFGKLVIRGSITGDEPARALLAFLLRM